MELPHQHLRVGRPPRALSFLVTDGGYAIARGVLAIAIETENLDAESEPAGVQIASAGHPLPGGRLRVGQVFACSGGASQDPDEPLQAHGWFGFHAERVEVQWTVVALREDGIEFVLEASHDDLDDDAGGTIAGVTQGRFLLSCKPRAELWSPE